MVRKVATVEPYTGAAELPAIFDRGEVAIVVDTDCRVTGLLTKLDLIGYLAKRPAAG